MKAAYLIRCSTKKQDYERQVRDLNKLVKLWGYEPTPPERIYGEHITGKDDATVRDRASIQHIKEDAGKKLFDVILVSEVSRMSRDVTSGMWYVRQLTNLGMPIYFKDVEIWTIDPNTGIKNSNAESILNGAFMAAAKYLKSMKTQIASGRRNCLAENKLILGSVPLGYKKAGGKDKETRLKLVVDEATAPIVKDVFEMYVQEGCTMKTVGLAIIQKYGIKFPVSKVFQTLERSLYYSGKHLVTMIDPDTSEKEDFWLTAEPIISEELFNRATIKRNSNRTVREPYPVQKTHLLSKLVKCPICGYSFTPHTRRGYEKEGKYRMINGKIAYSWNCMSRINNNDQCNSHISLNDEKCATIIWGLIKEELISSANLSNEQRQEKIELLSEKLVNAQNDIENYKVQKEQMQKRIKKAFDIYMDAPEEIQEMAKQRYYETAQKCQQEIAQCENKIESLISQTSMYLDELEFYNQPIRPMDVIEEAEKDETIKRKLFVELIDKIHPYSVSHGVVVLEIYAKTGIYYILLNSYQKRKNRIAHYISGDYAIWQGGKLALPDYEKGSYFLVHKSLVAGKSPEDQKEYYNFDFKTTEALCSYHKWELNYDLW